MDQIRVGIVGYGNIGRGVLQALNYNEDVELVAVFTRRDPLAIGVPCAVSVERIEQYRGKIDVLLLCGGSATDLPVQAPGYAAMFNTIDSFDTHPHIPEQFAKVDAAARQGDTLAMMSTGWDPGLFSMQRVLFEAALPAGKTYTFWGKGVSQGHSDALRRIPGILDARQYTVPVDKTLEEVRQNRGGAYTARQMHTRHCYVVAEAGADKVAIEQAIRTMPDYFADYDVFIDFIDQATMDREHAGMPHAGNVIRLGVTSDGTNERMEFSLNLDSNPEFTGSVMIAFARALHRMYQKGMRGAVTPLDVPVGLLSKLTAEQLRATRL